VQATFADGSAQMKMESPDTNNLTTNFTVALTVFNPICARFSTNEWGARAWGEMGDCYLQLSRYDDATNAFQKALDTLSAGPALRCQAQIGLGVVLEKKAALAPAEPEQTELFMQALKNYWEAFNRQGEEPAADPFWTKEAGLKAANLAAALGQWPQATMLYSNLVVLMPELKPALARKMDEASQHLNPPKR
jgi:tetratricopeptide (TPR) repeat protein